MKIALNFLSAQIGGGVSFARELTAGLLTEDRENEYLVFVPAQLQIEITGAVTSSRNLTVVGFRSPNILVRLFREQLQLPFLIRRNRVDVLLSPANLASFFAPCRQVLWIQNIDPFHYFRNEGRVRQTRNRLLFWLGKLSIKIAARVVFSSAHSRALVERRLGKPLKKAVTINLGVAAEYFASAKPAPDARPGYILSVSNISKRKNYELLLQAYALLSPALQAAHRLVLVGRVAPGYQAELLSRHKAASAKVVFTGEQKGRALIDYYRQGGIFILPSLVESFGLTVVEAMASGLPVLAADATCLPEIVGEAGLLFDPHDPADLAGKITRVLTDEKLQKELIARGKERAGQFRWSQTARRLLAVFKELS
ncbi:MAG: glycosyltransferase family 1 protein [Candidatus Margulisiibacteriota bacterium]